MSRTRFARHANARLASVGSAASVALATLFVVSSSVAFSGCGGGDAPRAPVVRREVGPQWQDVFDDTPELYAVVRPRAFKRDPLYGAFYASLLRIAQARSGLGGLSALEVAESCDEIIVGISRKGRSEDDAVIVFRGVPASHDARKLTDASGQPLLRVLDDRAKVPELERADPRGSNGSLFVLPDRTWVAALGPARARARQAFASPFGRPSPKADEAALAVLRIDPAAFGNSARATRNPVLQPLLNRLTSITLALKPGKDGVVATFRYEGEDHAAWAEMHLKRLFQELAENAASNNAPPERPPASGGRRASPPPPPPNPARLAWLKDAQVGREGSTVMVRLPIPPRLLEELPSATGSDIPDVPL